MNPSSTIEIVQRERRGRVVILDVRGRLDVVTAPQLLAQCAQVQADGADLIIDFSGVSFLGSSGVGAMLTLVEQFHEQGGQVHYAALSEPAMAVITLLDLQNYLPICANVDAALAEKRLAG